MKIGDRVRINTEHSSAHGATGTIKRKHVVTHSSIITEENGQQRLRIIKRFVCWDVLLDGSEYPVHFGENVVVPE